MSNTHDQNHSESSSGNNSGGEYIDAAPSDIGILLVHGIGEQRLGQTLSDYGQPLQDWLHKWVKRISEKEAFMHFLQKGQFTQHEQLLERLQKGTVSLDDAEFLADQWDVFKASTEENFEGFGAFLNATTFTPSSSDTPPHYHMQMQCWDENNHIEEAWLVAESHWADSFPQPDIQTVSQWLLIAIPWVCVTHAYRRVQSRLNRLKTSRLNHAILIKLSDFFLSTIYGIVFLLLGGVLQLTVLLLMVLGGLPIPYINTYIRNAQRIISSIIGDSFIFSSHPLSLSAIVSKVHRDIAWLEKRCKQVVIIAHSQGAGVTYKALRKHIPSKLKRWITFGSGLLKLEELTKARDHIYRFNSLSILVNVMILVGLFFTFFMEPNYDWFPRWANGVGLLLGALLSGYVLSRVPQQLEQSKFVTDDIKDLGWRLADREIFWGEIYATRDPVPNGPTFSDEADTYWKYETAQRGKAPFMSSVEVVNEQSLFTDHTSYKINRDSFFPEIMRLLCHKNPMTSLPLTPDTLTASWQETIRSMDDFLVLNRARLFRAIHMDARSLVNFVITLTFLVVIFGELINTARGGENFVFQTFLSNLVAPITAPIASIPTLAEPAVSGTVAIIILIIMLFFFRMLARLAQVRIARRNAEAMFDPGFHTSFRSSTILGARLPVMLWFGIPLALLLSLMHLYTTQSITTLTAPVMPLLLNPSNSQAVQSAVSILLLAAFGGFLFERWYHLMRRRAIRKLWNMYRDSAPSDIAMV